MFDPGRTLNGWTCQLLEGATLFAAMLREARDGTADEGCTITIALLRKFNVHRSVMVLFTCLVGCGSGLRVSSIQLGRSLNADSTVASHTTTFAPSDTVYVSVVTAGVGSGTISVRWTYAGRVVDEPKKHVSYRDVAATEFHLQSAGGFPPGEYTAEVFLDEQSVGTRAFRVETQELNRPILKIP